MDCSLILLVILTILEIILFQQVYVYLILDTILLEKCKKGVCDLENDGKTGTYYFLVICSVVNLLISCTNLVFIYIVRSRQINKRKEQFSVFCLNVSVIKEIVMCWSLFKITFSVILLLNISNTGDSRSWVDYGYFIPLFLFSCGKIPKTIQMNKNHLFTFQAL